MKHTTVIRGDFAETITVKLGMPEAKTVIVEAKPKPKKKKVVPKIPATVRPQEE